MHPPRASRRRLHQRGKLRGDDGWHRAHDGYRMLCRIENGIAHVVSRNGKEWTDNFPTIARASAKLPVNNAWLDGEICVVDAKGRRSFQALQNVLRGRYRPARL